MSSFEGANAPANPGMMVPEDQPTVMSVVKQPFLLSASKYRQQLDKANQRDADSLSDNCDRITLPTPQVTTHTATTNANTRSMPRLCSVIVIVVHAVAGMEDLEHDRSCTIVLLCWCSRLLLLRKVVLPDNVHLGQCNQGAKCMQKVSVHSSAAGIPGTLLPFCCILQSCLLIP